MTYDLHPRAFEALVLLNLANRDVTRSKEDVNIIETVIRRSGAFLSVNKKHTIEDPAFVGISIELELGKYITVKFDDGKEWALNLEQSKKICTKAYSDAAHMADTIAYCGRKVTQMIADHFKFYEGFNLYTGARHIHRGAAQALIYILTQLDAIASARNFDLTNKHLADSAFNLFVSGLFFEPKMNTWLGINTAKVGFTVNKTNLNGGHDLEVAFADKKYIISEYKELIGVFGIELFEQVTKEDGLKDQFYELECSLFEFVQGAHK